MIVCKRSFDEDNHPETILGIFVRWVNQSFVDVIYTYTLMYNIISHIYLDISILVDYELLFIKTQKMEQN